jgi:hypothetical protein
MRSLTSTYRGTQSILWWEQIPRKVAGPPEFIVYPLESDFKTAHTVREEVVVSFMTV